jgi:hypothetical protein
MPPDATELSSTGDEIRPNRGALQLGAGELEAVWGETAYFKVFNLSAPSGAA